MEIAKWMKHPVRFVKPLDSILHARELMEAHRINQLPVLVGGRIVGIITDRDLRDAFPSVLADPSRRDALDPHHVTVEAVMTQNVLTLAPGDSLIAAASLMRRERIGAIPIVDGTHLVGMLTRSDLLEALVGLDALLESGSGAGKR